MTILDQRHVTARKSHVCQMCGLGIASGERYLREKRVTEYGFETYCWCALCESLAEDLYNVDVIGEDPDTGSDSWPWLPDLVGTSEIPEGDLSDRFAAWVERWQKGRAW